MNMSRTIILFFVLLSPALLCAQESNEKMMLKNLLDDFLEGASNNNAEIHDRFWAEDLIYTSSNGERVTKNDIMNGLRDDEDSMNSEIPDYHAEDVQIRLYGEMAVIAFKLVAVSGTTRGEQIMEFYNTGTFQKRDGDWKAVAWQATRIPQE